MAPSSSINQSENGLDCKVVGLWEVIGTQETRLIGLAEQSSITLVGDLLTVKDSSGCKASIKVDDIDKINHTLPTDKCPFSLILIVAVDNNKNQFLVGVEGGMLPLLKELIDNGIPILSMSDGDKSRNQTRMMSLLTDSTPTKNSGILKVPQHEDL